MATIIGTADRDTLTGTPLLDGIYGRGGGDTINGEAGDDLLHGEAGHDRIRGGAGADRIRGGSGNDLGFGGLGDDVILGEDGDDRLYGQEGWDWIRGGGGADRIQIRTFPPDTSLEGVRLNEIAQQRGLDPIDTTIEMLKEAEGSVSIVSFNMHGSDMEAFMTQPWRMTASDGDLVPMGEGVPHPRSYGTFPRMLADYSRDEQIVPLSKAIHSMTGLPATVHRLDDRGFLRQGMVADIVVFDLEGLADVATFTEPHQLAEGIEYVFVNGELALDDGEFTDVLSGRVLNRNGDDYTRE